MFQHFRSSLPQDGMVEDLPEAEKRLDQLLGVSICMDFGGEFCNGTVRDIDIDSVTRERLYRVVYEDGDEEHLTEADVIKCRRRRQSMPARPSSAAFAQPPLPLFGTPSSTPHWTASASAPPGHAAGPTPSMATPCRASGNGSLFMQDGVNLSTALFGASPSIDEHAHSGSGLRGNESTNICGGLFNRPETPIVFRRSFVASPMHTSAPPRHSDMSHGNFHGMQGSPHAMPQDEGQTCFGMMYGDTGGSSGGPTPRVSHASGDGMRWSEPQQPIWETQREGPPPFALVAVPGTQRTYANREMLFGAEIKALWDFISVLPSLIRQRDLVVGGVCAGLALFLAIGVANFCVPCMAGSIIDSLAPGTRYSSDAFAPQGVDNFAPLYERSQDGNGAWSEISSSSAEAMRRDKMRDTIQDDHVPSAAGHGSSAPQGWQGDARSSTSPSAVWEIPQEHVTLQPGPAYGHETIMGARYTSSQRPASSVAYAPGSTSPVDRASEGGWGEFINFEEIAWLLFTMLIFVLMVMTGIQALGGGFPMPAMHHSPPVLSMPMPSDSPSPFCQPTMFNSPPVPSQAAFADVSATSDFLPPTGNPEMCTLPSPAPQPACAEMFTARPSAAAFPAVGSNVLVHRDFQVVPVTVIDTDGFRGIVRPLQDYRSRTGLRKWRKNPSGERSDRPVMMEELASGPFELDNGFLPDEIAQRIPPQQAPMMTAPFTPMPAMEMRTCHPVLEPVAPTVCASMSPMPMMDVSNTPASQPRSAPIKTSVAAGRVQRFPYQGAFNAIKSMGFEDDELIKTALRQSRGNRATAIDRLLGR